MLLLGNTVTKINLITGSAGTIVANYSAIDYSAGTVTPVTPANISISTATTTDIVAAPAASTSRNVQGLTVRNTHASVQNLITLQHTDGTVVVPIWSGVLLPSESIRMDENGVILKYSAGGIVVGAISTGSLFNQSVAAQGAGFATDTYLTGSSILIPAQLPRVGTKYSCRFDMLKTAAGVGQAIVAVRYGTAGAIGDTIRLSFTFGVQTAVVDTGLFEITAVFRTVGSGTNAVLQGICALTNLAATGLSSTFKGVSATSSSFDSTVASSYIGVSFNGNAAFSGTAQLVETELSNV